MSEMISESGAVRDVNEIAATEPADLPEISMEEAIAIMEDTGPILADPEDATSLDELSVSLSSTLEQLNSMRHELTASGQISRADAAMLKNLTASAESIGAVFTRLPISSFTELPSKVNYTATCEGLGKSIVDTVIAFIKGVFKYIIAIGKWFINFMTSRRRKDQQNDQADKAIEKKNQELDKKAVDIAELQAKDLAERLARIDALAKKIQPMYSRLVELMVDQTTIGPGDPLCREELMGFANLSGSGETLRQVEEEVKRNHQHVVNVIHEQSYFINSYNTMAKAYPKLASLPLKDLCNYPGLLVVLREFKKYIQGLSTERSSADITEASFEVVRKYNQNTPHIRFNNLLAVVEANLKGNEATLKAIDANTEKSKSLAFLPDDFFPSRQRAAQQVKDKDLVLQELVQIQNIFAGARDRTSQMALEYARARDGF